MWVLLWDSSKESFDVFVLGPAEQFIRPFKDYFPITQHEKPRVGDTHEVILALEINLAVAVRRIFRGQGECIAHAMGDENAGDTLDVAKRDKEFVDFF